MVHLPIFSVGWAITVKGGSMYRAQNESSKLTIDSRWGTAIFSSRTKAMAPAAISIFAAKRAVGG